VAPQSQTTPRTIGAVNKYAGRDRLAGAKKESGQDRKGQWGSEDVPSVEWVHGGEWEWQTNPCSLELAGKKVGAGVLPYQGKKI